MLKYAYREPVATGPSKVALISRSIHKSHYLARRSAPGNVKVVLPRQSFRRVEVHRFPAVDPWEAYDIQPFLALLSLMRFVSIAGSGKSVLWCAVSHVSPFQVT